MKLSSKISVNSYLDFILRDWKDYRRDSFRWGPYKYREAVVCYWCWTEREKKLCDCPVSRLLLLDENENIVLDDKTERPVIVPWE